MTPTETSDRFKIRISAPGNPSLDRKYLAFEKYPSGTDETNLQAIDKAPPASAFHIVSDTNAIVIDGPGGTLDNPAGYNRQPTGVSYRSLVFAQQQNSGLGKVTCDFGKENNQVNCQSDKSDMFFQFCGQYLRLNDGPVADDGCSTVVLNAISFSTP